MSNIKSSRIEIEGRTFALDLGQYGSYLFRISGCGQYNEVNLNKDELNIMAKWILHCLAK